MDTAFEALRQAMLQGDIQMTTPKAEIVAEDLAQNRTYGDVTAMIWQAKNETWHAHFCEVLNETAMQEVLSYYQKPSESRENV
jgi:hypothetical protein